MMKHPNSLPRRVFLKLSGTASLGLALSACGLTQNTDETGTPALTRFPTASSTPTPQPSSTPEPTASPTATPPPVSVSNWASYISGDKKGTINLDAMRTVTIPALRPAPKTVDLQIATMRLAAVTNQDVSVLSANELQKVRLATIEELENSPTFMQQVELVQQAITALIDRNQVDPESNSDLSLVTLVAVKSEDGQYVVSGVIVREKERTSRFLLTAKERLEELSTILSWREVGEYIGIVIGETSMGWNNYGDSEYQKAMGKYFTMIWTGVFMDAILRGRESGAELIPMFMEVTRRYRQILTMGPVFHTNFLDPAIINGSTDTVQKWVDLRINDIVSNMAPKTEDEKPTYVILGAEFILWVDPMTRQAHSPTVIESSPGSGKMVVNPITRVLGSDALSEVYTRFVAEAGKKGLEAGRDYRMIYKHIGWQTPEALTAVLQRQKEIIAGALGKDPADVQLDVDMEIPLFLNPSDPSLRFVPRPPTDEQLTHAIDVYKKIGPVHISEVNVVGAKSQEQRVEELSRILSLALRTGCESIGFWNILRSSMPVVEKNTDYNEAQGIFGPDYEPIPGGGYDQLLAVLINFGIEKGLL